MTRISQKLMKKPEILGDRFHSLQLWWTIVVAIALGISYLADQSRGEKLPKSAQKAPYFERVPAQASQQAGLRDHPKDDSKPLSFQ